MMINLRERIKNQKGFTLVELMVVIAIIGILAAIAVPKLSSSTDSAKVAKIQADLRTLGGALAIYYADNSAYPEALTGLEPKYIAKVPEPPKAATALVYAYDKTNGIVSCAFNGTTYNSDGSSGATKK